MGLSDTVTADPHRLPQEMKRVHDFHGTGRFKQVKLERRQNLNKKETFFIGGGIDGITSYQPFYDILGYNFYIFLFPLIS